MTFKDYLISLRSIDGMENYTITETALIVDAFLSNLSTLETDDTVNVRGVGTFKKYVSKPSKRRNIHTGEWVEAPSKERIKFKQSYSTRKFV